MGSSDSPACPRIEDDNLEPWKSRQNTSADSTCSPLPTSASTLTCSTKNGRRSGRTTVTTAALLPSERHTHHPDTITRRFNRLGRHGGCAAHPACTTSATLSLDVGVDPKIMSDPIGHDQHGVTLRSTHRSTGRQREAARPRSGSLASSSAKAGRGRRPAKSRRRGCKSGYRPGSYQTKRPLR